MWARSVKTCARKLVPLRLRGATTMALSDLRAVPLDDPGEVGAPWQGAEGQARVALQARGAEGVGDRRIAVANQQRGLQRQRHPLDHASGPRLDLFEVR